MREVKPTQKPVPSSDIKDLFFNSGLLDIWATSLERKYIDRFGNCHLTAAGMEWIFNELVTKFKIESEQALLAAGYAPAGTFQEGAEVVSRNGTVLWKLPDGDGEHYRWDGDLPKQVPAGSTPQSTGGVGKGAWVSVGDASLRADLATWKGSSIIDGGNLTVFKKHGLFGDGGSVTNIEQAIQDSDGFWYIYTGVLPHNYSESHSDDWVNVGLLNGHPVNSIENYGAVASSAVLDNSAAINLCIAANYRLGRKTVAGGGEFFVSKPIDVLMGSHYKYQGTIIEGAGIVSTTFTMIGSSTEPVFRGPESTSDKYNANLRNFSIYGNGNSSAAIGFKSEVSRVNISGIRTEKCVSGIHLPRNAWICSFKDLNLNGGEYGIKMDDSGTTNTFDEIFVFGTTKTAYKIRTSYSNIGSLAADECTGILYDFQFCNGLSVNALGFEQPSNKYPSKVIYLDNSIATHINTITGWNGTPTDGDTPFDLVDIGSAKGAKVGGITLTNTRGGAPVNGSLVTGYTGVLELGDVNLSGVSFKTTTRNTDISLNIKPEKGIGVFFNRPYSKPLLAGGLAIIKGIGLTSQQESRKIPSVYSDNLKSPMFGQSSNDGELPAPEVGDLFLCNDPWKYGVYGYVCIQKGNSIASSRFGIIPCIVDSATPPSEPASRGVQWFDATDVRIKTWNGSNWV